MPVEEIDPSEPCPYDVIVHAAAYTDVAAADLVPEEAARCFRSNVVGTRKLAAWARSAKVVYISTEYVFDGERGGYVESDATDPVNFYSMTKAQGEREVTRTVAQHLILRTLFKPRPFEWPQACIDMWTSGDYVDVIAPEVDRAIELFIRGRVSGILHVGTGRKSIFELARKSRDVTPIERRQLSVTLPRDTSLNLDRWRAIRDSA